MKDIPLLLTVSYVPEMVDKISLKDKINETNLEKGLSDWSN